MAGGVLWYLYNRYGAEIPFVGIMESNQVPCIFESVRQGRLIETGGHPHTIMAGLNCGIVNPAIFSVLQAYGSAFIQCGDCITRTGMDRAAHPIAGDPAFSSGESGAVGLGLLESIGPKEREILQLGSDSTVLLFSTEGVLPQL